MRLSRKLLLNLLGGGGIRYLLRDLFSTDRPATLNATAAEPGPGTRTVVDTGSRISISSGILTIATHASIAAASCIYGTIAVVGGRAIKFDAKGISGSANCFYGYVSPIQRCFTHAGYIQDGNGLAISVGDAVSTSQYDAFAIIRRSDGTTFFIKNNVLVFIDNVASMVARNVGIESNFQTVGGNIDNLRVADLPYPWNTDYGIATQRLAGARSAGDTFAHEANCLIEYTVTTLPSASIGLFRFRIQDDNNHWFLEWYSTGDILLRENVAGTPTTRGSAAAVLSNGHRVVVIADGTTIRVFTNNTLRITYSSATNFQTQTSGKLQQLGTSGAVSDIVSWPRTLSGVALSTLQRV